MDYVILIAGFALLAYAADFLVNGASAIAKRLKISDLAIGLTVVAFGTSAPEFVVNLVASLKGSNEIAFTNILGSNCINIFVILGLSALIFPLAAQKSTLLIEVPLSLLAAVLVWILGLDYLHLGEISGLSSLDGLILLIFFALFLVHAFRTARSAPDLAQGPEEKAPDEKPLSLLRALLYIVGGLTGLVLGGNLVVNAAVKLATAWGVSDAVIGATIVALGTSLPELATSVVAAVRKKTDIAIGNVIGSNLFNIFLVLGLSSVIHPIKDYPGLQTDVAFTILSSLMVFLFLFLSRKRTITRLAGLSLLLVYGLYLYLLLS